MDDDVRELTSTRGWLVENLQYSQRVTCCACCTEGDTVSKFLTTLNVKELDDSTNDGRGTWELTWPLIYKSDVAATTFVVPVGFQTDFASVPRIPIAFDLTGDSAHEAAVVHDFLYTGKDGVHEVTRSVADSVLREASIVSGVPAWRAWMMWAGVRLGGASHWR